MSRFYCVSIYLVDKAYGGPEEGGWWYTYGEPALEHGHLTRVFKDEDTAVLYCRKLRDRWEPVANRHRRDIDSVLSEGQYRAKIDEDRYPISFPAERPHYE